MFDDDDSLLEHVRRLAAEFPNADEKVSHGGPAFFTKKVFACYGGSLEVDGEWIEHPHSIMAQPDVLEDRRTDLIASTQPSTRR
jgi:hypothetical protein